MEGGSIEPEYHPAPSAPEPERRDGVHVPVRIVTDAIVDGPIVVDAESAESRLPHTDWSNGGCCFTCHRILALPFVGINMIYNLRLELLIIWAVYEIARSTCLAGNTRTAHERGMAAASADKADLECTDVETAAEDFEIYGLFCIFIIVAFFSVQWIYFLCRIWYFPYGSIGYVQEYVRARRSIGHKFLVLSMLFVIVCMIIYGFIVAGAEGAPIGMVASPLLEGLYTCVVACYELFDSQAYSLRAKSSEVKMVILPFRSAFTDIMGLYHELELAVLAAKLEPAQLKGLEDLGLDDLTIGLLLGDGLDMHFDHRMVLWKAGKYFEAMRASEDK